MSFLPTRPKGLFRVLLARLGVGFFAGVVMTIVLIDTAYYAGLQDGKAQRVGATELTNILRTETATANKVCGQWWFGMHNIDRRVR